jgi:mannosyl-oligosaccharide glucosidase
MTGNGRRNARSRSKPATEANDDDASLRNTKPNPKARKGRSRDHSSIQIFDVNLKVVLGLSVFAFLAIFFLIRHLVNPAEEALRPRVVTPFPAPKVMDLPQVKCDIFPLFILFSFWYL